MAKKKDKLTNDVVLSDFWEAYEYKKPLIEEQKKDHLFALGKQWSEDAVAKLRRKRVKAITDNRIRPNIFLLTGLERQNRTDFRAFPEGEEDSIHAQIATALFKNVMKQSEGEFKFSEMFEDGITGGESYLELFLDSTYNLLSPKPKWKKVNYDQVYPKPGFCEYDFTDVPWVYKFTPAIEKEDLIGLFPKMRSKIEEVESGLLDPWKALKNTEVHVQREDYPDRPEDGIFHEEQRKGTFDLIERYYKKYVETSFVFDTQEGDLIEALPIDDEDDRSAEEIAKDFIRRMVKGGVAEGRFQIRKQTVPQIWRYAMTGAINEPLEDKLAWFYPRWRGWPFIPYFARWTNIANKFDSQARQLGTQGIVRGSKDSQEEHNKRKTQYLRYIDTATNTGWLTEEGAWVDPKKVEELGSSPMVNLEYKRGRPRPERLFPMPLSQAHVFSAAESAEAIKAQTGINTDLLAAQDGGQASGRAIALRQRQGVIMVQSLFDNLSRTKKLAGKFLLSQLSEIYHIRAVKRVLGEEWMTKNFGELVQDENGAVQMQFTGTSDARLTQVINEVLNDINIGKYDVVVGESVMSETMRKAQFEEMKEFIELFPQLINPEVVIEESTLPSNVKGRLLKPIQQARLQALNNLGGNGGPQDNTEAREGGPDNA